jgi:tripartite-type tricarboxylate transporter receptor subunit TctC
MRKSLSLVVIFALELAWTAHAQEFPSQAIHMVIPYAPGGGSDILARPVAQEVQEKLKQPVVVDNRGGAGGNIGAQIVARSAPDGYTLLVANNSHTINPFIYKEPGYDMAVDFAPISLLATSPAVLVVPESSPAKTMGDLIANARKKSNSLNFGSPGVGTPGHLASVLFSKQAGIDATHVAYKGTGPTTIAVLAGEIDYAFLTPAAVEPHVKSGKLRALAVTSRERFPAFPNVPTVAESKLPGLGNFEVEIWWGVLAPARTDERVLNKLHAAVTEAVKDPKMQQRWLAQGMVPKPTTRAEFAAIIKSDLAKYQNVVKDNNIQAE